MNFGMQYEIRRRTVSDIWEHLPFLHETALSYPRPNVLELGVRTGNSTAAFLAAVEAKGAGHVWSVDINPAQVPPSWHDSPGWTFIQGDDTVASSLASWCSEPWLDILFIDSSHERQHTLTELKTYVPLVRPGGVVLAHDTELAGSGVAAALDEFCAGQGLSWVSRAGCCGLGVLHIPEADGGLD